MTGPGGAPCQGSSIAPPRFEACPLDGVERGFAGAGLAAARGFALEAADALDAAGASLARVAEGSKG